MLVNLMPSGTYLMEDFAYAGGLPAVMQELAPLLHMDHVTVSGRSVAENVDGAQCWNRDVIGTMEEPFQPAGSGTVVLRGSLAPSGAVLKVVRRLRPTCSRTRGPALVFDRIEDYLAAADDPDLDVTPDTVIVVRNAGPRGYPGLPGGRATCPCRDGCSPTGITDMVRISDARMSGTGYGTCVLHVAPEASVGGPLALVRTGDLVRVDVAGAPPGPPGRRRGARPTPRRLAAARSRWPTGAGCGSTASTSCRPTAARTSTSSSVAAAARCPVTHTDGHRRTRPTRN